MIVLAVLIALWADAWRSSLSEAAQARQYLEQLAAEVDSARAQLRTVVVQDSLHMAWARASTDALRSRQPWSNHDSVTALLRIRMARYRPSLPTLGALLRTEATRLVVSPVLRGRLERTSAALETATGILDTSWDRYRERLGQARMEEEPLLRRSRERHPFEIPAEGTEPNILRWIDEDLLRASPVLAALFSQQAVDLRTRLGAEQRLLSALDELASALAAELQTK